MYLGILSVNDVVYFRANTVDRNGSALDATVGPDFQVFTNNGSTVLASGTMTKIYSEEGTYEGSFTATDDDFLDGQHFILIDATVDGQTPKAHIAFQLVSDDLSLEETFQEIELIGQSIPIIGEGTISIDHNFGATDNYRVTASGTPLADVDIRAFVKTDYDNGLRANKHIVGQTKTGTNGRWVSVIRLDPGDYVLEFSKPGQYRTATVTVTVTGSVGVMSFSAMGMDMDMNLMSAEMTMEPYASTTYPQTVQSFSAPASPSVYVDHNYKSKDNLRLMSKGKGIEGVDIKIYKKEDYDAGRLSEEFVLQRTITTKDGRWERSIRLESNQNYVIAFGKKDQYSTSIKVIKL